MTPEERRKAILDALHASQAPLSGSALSERFEVSRQVVVQDIALLRSSGSPIVSTNRGYVLNLGGGEAHRLAGSDNMGMGDAGGNGAGGNGAGADDPRTGRAGESCRSDQSGRPDQPGRPGQSGRPSRLFKVRHTTQQTQDELNAIVDLGGRVLNVIVNHRVYGRMEAPLDIRSRRDARRFVEDLAAGVSSPLMTITDGYHFHRVEADDDQTLGEIEEALRDLGFLAELTDYERERGVE